MDLTNYEFSIEFAQERKGKQWQAKNCPLPSIDAKGPKKESIYPFK